MRLSQFEMENGQEILDILNNTQYCHIAMTDNAQPYIVTMFYAYLPEYKRIYVHGAKEGRKANVFEKGGTTVCVQIIDDIQIIPDESPCDYFSAYRSIVCDGIVRPAIDEEKKVALDLIAKKYSGLESFSFSQEALDSVSCWGIELLTVVGKKIPKCPQHD
ncbi:MAG: pyridoxamine 5'-phosphate oxidase family protein [Bacillota bacterium]|jgi:nitroimidazol reductase NimA-like FMN-containing flavoprotein (pyridoxamine 5'-phosphate oxidase superfamily)